MLRCNVKAFPMGVLLLVAAVVMCTTAATLADASLPARLLPEQFIMPWFCTQRCGFNESQIVDHLSQLIELRTTSNCGLLTVIAFERYNLGPNSTLIFNENLFDINGYVKHNETLSSLVTHRIAMVSSYPYPPKFLDWMRQLFANPDPFLEALIGDLVVHDIHGVNIDFEPSGKNATAEDAAKYALFLARLKKDLEKAGKVLTVAGATWSTIWNLTEIAQALKPSTESGATGYFTSMNTYTYKDQAFLSQLTIDLDAFGQFGTADSLVVGLETWTYQISNHELVTHFAALANHSVCRLAIWDMPIPAAMVPFLANVSQRCQ